MAASMADTNPLSPLGYKKRNEPVSKTAQVQVLPFIWLTG